jgi:glycosyltransferase involved in cell wall biosynthesis
MHSSKLLHRQVEAMAVLRGRGVSGMSMRIAGSICGPSTQDMSPYARSVVAKIKRLHLDDCVKLVGEIDGMRQKARFLNEARLVINLSVSIEESFGKAIAEALGSGVPVLATRWDGFPETIGSAGACVPVDATALGLDVSAERIADTIQLLIEDPPDRQTCRREAVRFCPRRVQRLYRQELETALEALAHHEAKTRTPPDLIVRGLRWAVF